MSATSLLSNVTLTWRSNHDHVLLIVLVGRFVLEIETGWDEIWVSWKHWKNVFIRLHSWNPSTKFDDFVQHEAMRWRNCHGDCVRRENGWNWSGSKNCQETSQKLFSDSSYYFMHSLHPLQDDHKCGSAMHMFYYPRSHNDRRVSISALFCTCPIHPTFLAWPLWTLWQVDATPRSLTFVRTASPGAKHGGTPVKVVWLDELPLCQSIGGDPAWYLFHYILLVSSF